MTLALTSCRSSHIANECAPQQDSSSAVSLHRLGWWGLLRSLGGPFSLLPHKPAASTQYLDLSYEIETYDSQVMACSRTYGVVLPPNYDQQPDQHYPVIFLLHGGHGNPNVWFTLGKALTVLHQLYLEGRLTPSIIITPDGNDKRGSSPYFDPDYIDGPYGKVDTAIGDELVHVVQSRYRTLPTPTFWAIGGLSSGGWGAMNVGLHHLEHFSVLFSHSGYFSVRSDPKDSPVAYVKTLPTTARQSLRVYLDAGQGDGRYLNQTRQFHQVLDQSKISNVFHAFPGGHGITGSKNVGWNYWHQHLADSLAYVGEQLKSR